MRQRSPPRCRCAALTALDVVHLPLDDEYVYEEYTSWLERVAPGIGGCTALEQYALSDRAPGHHLDALLWELRRCGRLRSLLLHPFGSINTSMQLWQMLCSAAWPQLQAVEFSGETLGIVGLLLAQRGVQVSCSVLETRTDARECCADEPRLLRVLAAEELPWV